MRGVGVVSIAATFAVALLVPAACGSSPSCEETRTCSGTLGGDGGPESGIPAKFQIALSTSSLTVIEGATAELDVTVTRTGTKSPVTLEAIGLVSDVTAQKVNVPADADSAVFQILAKNGAKHGPLSIKIRASADGASVEQPLDLLVRGLPGSIDTSFGKDGVAQTSLLSKPLAPRISSTGDIYVAGTSEALAGVVRFNDDGELDTAFGNSGVVQLQDTFGASAFDVDAQGGVMVGGTKQSLSSALIGRFDVDGNPQTSFGDAGVSVLPDVVLSSLVAVANGDFLLAGFSGVGTFVGRIDAAGAPDSGYGTSGVFTLDPAPLNGACVLGVKADGSAYGLMLSDSYTDVRIAAISASGIVGGFGIGGIKDFDAGSGEKGMAIAARAGGGVFVSGTLGTTWFLGSLDTFGGEDTKFGTNGLLTGQALGVPYVFRGVAEDAQERLVTIGKGGSGWTVARFVGGTLDDSFGTAGLGQHPEPYEPIGFALAADGRIVVVVTFTDPATAEEVVGVVRVWN